MIIPGPEFGQVNFKFIGIGAPTGAECTLGFELIDQPDFSPEAAATAFRDIFVATLLQGMSDFVALSEVRVKYGPNATGPEGGITTSNQGTLAAQSATPNTTWLIRKGTAGGGRRARGRMYLPGIPENNVDSGGNIDATFRNAMQTQANEFLADCIAGGLAPMVLHAPGKSLVPAPTAITTLAVQPVVATQRRRLRR